MHLRKATWEGQAFASAGRQQQWQLNCITDDGQDIQIQIQIQIHIHIERRRQGCAPQSML